ncbi:MAG: type VI secretion system baseplate subunit TssF [Algicola sp.]|nr:type VI secretion system baseplate subunit TssF [Algicola sp.]
MAFNKYYQDELNYLKELGSLFGQQNPGLSDYLSEEGKDPDVQRLFEGFAFLTGRIRQKLDDELPEISHALINLIWPNYLRPVPSITILQFDETPKSLTDKQTIKRGCEVQSIVIEDTACQFRSCYDVDVYPLSISDAKAESYADRTELDLSFELTPGAASDEIGFDYLRLYLHCDQNLAIAQTLYLWLFNYLTEVKLTVWFRSGENNKHTIDTHCIKPVGFGPEQALLPGDNSTFSGYRLIQEYFQFPEKFLFFDITGIAEHLAAPKIEKFELKFVFSHPFDDIIRVTKDYFRLYCTPIVNLYQTTAEPITIDHHRQEYMLRPQHKNQQHIEIFSVDEVFGRTKAQSKPTIYASFESFEHESDKSPSSTAAFFKVVQKPSILSEGLDSHLSFVTMSEQDEISLSETVSVNLTCSNRLLAGGLRVGEITEDNGNSPDFVQFSNITRVTRALPPPLERGLHWRLISNMALNYHSLSSVDAFKVLIKDYDFKALTDRQAQRANKKMADGIDNISVESVDRIIKGIPVRGLKTTISMYESHFGSKGIQGEANMYQFCCILNAYFKQYARLNSFHSLEVKGLDSGEVFHWEAKRWQI